jgi:hypothetical protein
MEASMLKYFAASLFAVAALLTGIVPAAAEKARGARHRQLSL